MTHPVHILRDNVGITEVLGRCRLGDMCRLEHATKTEAVRAVRLRVFERYNYVCYFCGLPGTFESLQMHESELHRGRGGHYSLDNSKPVCEPCHRDEHPEKKLYWSKKEVGDGRTD